MNELIKQINKILIIMDDTDNKVIDQIQFLYKIVFILTCVVSGFLCVPVAFFLIKFLPWLANNKVFSVILYPTLLGIAPSLLAWYRAKHPKLSQSLSLKELADLVNEYNKKIN